jgi:hypothetical protein
MWLLSTKHNYTWTIFYICKLGLKLFLLEFSINLYIIFFIDIFGGKVIQRDVYDSEGRLVGKSYSITQVTYHDRGMYLCKTTNRFGVVQKWFDLKVSKRFG